MSREIVALTPAAIDRVRTLIETKGAGVSAIRLGVKTTGCPAFSYQLDFVENVDPVDQVVERVGIRLVVDAKSADLVSGVEIDFVEDKLGSMFVFRNPNEKSRCGCGESFSV